MATSPDIQPQTGEAPDLPHDMPLALDGHVHLQSDMPYALIAENFAKAAPGHSPVCLVVESFGIDRFSSLAAKCQSWGDVGLFDPATGLRFVAGRQVVSEEGLEILLIGLRDQALEGKPAERIIALGLEHKAAVCLPWGFGKWLGARRRLAASLHQRLNAQIMLGDITNRPALWIEPMLKRTRALRGSDNLPLQGSSETVGLFGSTIESGHAIQDSRDLVRALRDRDVPLRPYGRRKSFSASVGEQARLRRVKRAD